MLGYKAPNRMIDATKQQVEIARKEWLSDSQVRFSFQQTARELNLDSMQSFIGIHLAAKRRVLWVGGVTFALLLSGGCLNNDELIYWGAAGFAVLLWSLYEVSLKTVRKRIRKEHSSILNMEGDYNRLAQVVIGENAIQVRCDDPKTVFLTIPYQHRSRWFRFFAGDVEVLETEKYFLVSWYDTGWWVKKKNLTLGTVDDLRTFLKNKPVKLEYKNIEHLTVQHEIDLVRGEGL